MAARFNPAPGWPTPPVGWVPPAGWTRPPDWPTTPPGWQFWVDDATGLPVADPTVRRASWYARARVVVPAGVLGVLMVAGVTGAAIPGPVSADRAATVESAASTGELAEAAPAAPSEAAASDAASAEAAAAEAAAAEQERADAAAADAAAAEAAARAAAAEADAAGAAAALAAEQAAAEQAAAEQAAAEAAAAQALAAATWTVTDVVDGDTVDVQQGGLVERVRIIGIDTPERGSCGYEQAADVLAGHVLGQTVLLVPGARDDRDSYGRMLRYVDRASDGLDTGRSLLDAGLAVARYDSRDGYGGHPREAGYVAADAATGDSAVCAAAPPPVPVAPAHQADAGAGCDPAYPTVCLPSSPDVDCGEIAARGFPVLSPDPHRLDGSDNDGWGCESG